MPTREDVYQKFGETSEAAQLLENELGTALMFVRAADYGLMKLTEAGIEIENDPTQASQIFATINRQTLGQMIKLLKQRISISNVVEDLLSRALEERNRLQHGFFRQHNFRLNTDEGRAIMIADLDRMHEIILGAFQEMMRISGIDLDTLELPGLPTQHLPL